MRTCRFIRLAVLLWLPSTILACSSRDRPAELGPRFRVVARYPHDRTAYTQGLLFRDSSFYESTGLYGASSVRRVDITTGRLIERRDLPETYFAEGLAALNDRLYQLTWKEETGFVYGTPQLESVATFHYDGEGWGLTTDGTYLILSDGTYRLRFLDPQTFDIVKTVEVRDQGRVVFAINELEWVRGEIWGNIWQQDEIVRIDPTTGNVLGWLSTAGLLSSLDRWRGAEVANGIAYDSLTDRLWVTGKNWPRVYEVVRPGGG